MSDPLNLCGRAHLLDLIEIDAGIETGAPDQRQRLVADLCPAFRVTLDGALGLAGLGGGVGGEARRLVQVAKLATCSIPAMPRLRVQCLVGVLTLCRERRPLRRCQDAAAQVLVALGNDAALFVQVENDRGGWSRTFVLSWGPARGAARMICRNWRFQP